jgi:hypothetical protein
LTTAYMMANVPIMILRSSIHLIHYSGHKDDAWYEL